MTFPRARGIACTAAAACAAAATASYSACQPSRVPSPNPNPTVQQRFAPYSRSLRAVTASAAAARAAPTQAGNEYDNARKGLLFGDSGAVRWQRFMASHSPQQRPTSNSISSAAPAESRLLKQLDIDAFAAAMNALMRDYEGLRSLAAVYTDKRVPGGGGVPNDVFERFYALWMHVQTGFLAELLIANPTRVREMFDRIRTVPGVMELANQRTEVDETLSFALYMSGTPEATRCLQDEVKAVYAGRPSEYQNAVLKGLQNKYAQRLGSLGIQGDWPQLLCIRLGSYFVDPSEQTAKELITMLKFISDAVPSMPQKELREYSVFALTFVLYSLLQDDVAQAQARTMLQAGELNMDDKRVGWLAQATRAILGEAPAR